MKQYCYKYPRPEVTADCVVWGWNDGEVYVLLIRRGREPFRDCWALPGGFMEMDESAEACALRELQEETGLCVNAVRQVGVFSDPGRDPRGRVVTVAFYAFADMGQELIRAGDDAAETGWFSLAALPSLAFDHREIIETAFRQVKADGIISRDSLDEMAGMWPEGAVGNWLEAEGKEGFH